MSGFNDQDAAMMNDFLSPVVHKLRTVFSKQPVLEHCWTSQRLATYDAARGRRWRPSNKKFAQESGGLTPELNFPT